LEAAVKWNGAWQAIPPGKPFDHAGDPNTPANVRIGAADTPQDYAYTGDFADSFGMDSAIAMQRRSYWHDIAAARIGSRTIQLGLGSVSAMRRAFIAGEDAGNGTRDGLAPSYAVLWRCLTNIAAVNPCARRVLGPGTPYGVDSRGDVVGGDSTAGGGELQNSGRPILWRAAGRTLLSDQYGAAYAISENGEIVGAFGGQRAYNGLVYGRFSGFVADAHSSHPKAIALDRLVRTLGKRHIEAAFGVADDGRILVYVVPTDAQYPEEHRRLAILVPQ
jgi:hypothetical protein